MKQTRFPRRYSFYESLLTGAVPMGDGGVRLLCPPSKLFSNGNGRRFTNSHPLIVCRSQRCAKPKV